MYDGIFCRSQRPLLGPLSQMYSPYISPLVLLGQMYIPPCLVWFTNKPCSALRGAWHHLFVWGCLCPHEAFCRVFELRINLVKSSPKLNPSACVTHTNRGNTADPTRIEVSTVDRLTPKNSSPLPHRNPLLLRQMSADGKTGLQKNGCCEWKPWVGEVVKL